MSVGFEAIFAIAGVLTVIYLLWREKIYTRWKNFWKERKERKERKKGGIY